MKIVFMGTPEFAVASLDQLHKSKHDVVGVITATDKPAGRGQKVSYSAVKQYALEHGLRLLQPEKLKATSFLSELASLEADLFVVVAFRMLPEVVWMMPPKGTINLHASLLPNYRGAAPINWAIINGEKETGATTFFIEKQMDTGNVIDQIKVTISEDMNAGTLHDILMTQGSELLLRTVNAIENGTATSKPQSELTNEATKEAFKIFKETCTIDWNKSNVEIHNLIRGLSPYPAAFTEFTINGTVTPTKIFKSTLDHSHSIGIGKIQTNFKNEFMVGCGLGNLLLEELQIAGKKRMDIVSFLNGNKQSSFN